MGDAEDLAAIYRREVGRCTATLIRVLGDVDLAEDAVAEAFAAAADRWPRDGLPANPGAWITTTARNRAIDRLRRESSRQERQLAAHRHWSFEAGSTPTGPYTEEARDMADRSDGHLSELDRLVEVVADDQLRLMFLCCHPALHPDAQVALTLRLLGGLDTPEIARAFVVAESTMAQRIVRAKRKLRDNRAPYRIPTDTELPDRLGGVLAAILLIYTEGHSASSGGALVRIDLCAEAIRLARTVVELLPERFEAVGLLARLLLTDARRPARVATDGSMIGLADQDRSLWDRDRIAEGHQLVRACLRNGEPGPHQIHAAIAAVHADAPAASATDWGQIVALYDQLLTLRPDPVVGLNRAVAIAERDGPYAGLAALGELDLERLEHYQPFHAVRAGLLARRGSTEAVAAFERALSLTSNPAEVAYLVARRDEARVWRSEGATSTAGETAP